MFVDLPWRAWTADEQHRVRLSDSWQVDYLAPRNSPSCTDPQIRESLHAPIASPRLIALAEGKRTACVVVDDLARPTEAAEILPAVLDELKAGGLSLSSITILVATGTHGPLTPAEVDLKIGRQAAEKCRVIVHSESDAEPTGIMYGQTELRVNKHFLAADLKIGLGSVLPHSFAGYSGGAKLMLPGLADTTATARSHKFVQMGLRGGGDPNQNKFRLEIEGLARQLDFNFTICVVPNVSRRTTALFCGDIVEAHRAACAEAGVEFATPVHETYDCLLLNAYPKDGDLIQAENALICLKTASMGVVKEDGLIVLMTAASTLGSHGLFAPGGASHRTPRPNRAIGTRDFWIYAPRLTESVIRQRYWDGYPHVSDADKLIRRLEERLAVGARVGVVPAGPVQQLSDERGTDKQ